MGNFLVKGCKEGRAYYAVEFVVYVEGSHVAGAVSEAYALVFAAVGYHFLFGEFDVTI